MLPLSAFSNYRCNNLKYSNHWDLQYSIKYTVIFSNRLANQLNVEIIIDWNSTT